jgi:uncharacterized protein YqfB (UPF0267 family)
MVAYSFKSRFAAPILAGTKAQTIRADRKRHARPGEMVQLFTGMRTRQCRRLGEARCLEVVPIRQAFAIQGQTELIRLGDRFIRSEGFDAFAQQDGFADMAHMAKFWWANHPPTKCEEFEDPDSLIFAGVLIVWQPLAPADTRKSQEA